MLFISCYTFSKRLKIKVLQTRKTALNYAGNLKMVNLKLLKELLSPSCTQFLKKKNLFPIDESH